MDTKKCKSCKIGRAISEFYNHLNTKDGLSSVCKQCQRGRSLRRFKELSKNPDFRKKERERTLDAYYRLYQTRAKDKTAKERIKKKYYNKFPEKEIAERACVHIKKRKGFHLHHWSYNIDDLKSTIELPTKEHFKLHRFLIYDQERLMYRRSDTNELLDTKEKHIEYYNAIKHFK